MTDDRPAPLARLRRRVRLSVVIAAVALQAACSNTAGIPGIRLEKSVTEAPPPAELTVSGFRESPGTVAAGGIAAPYNYGPTVLRDGGQYRTWWCSQLPGVGPPGDDILHATSESVGGAYTAGGVPAVPVFSAQPGGFDGMHTCDPSVLRVGGRYYLYYTGAAGDHAHGNAIGVASSPDGLTWQREAGGQPIVTPSREVNRSNVYGAGQPSALFVDGWFYLMFTDTTASGAGWNGAGQFVLRSRNPQFTGQVESLTESGFQPVASTHASRPRSVVDAFSADWMWMDALGAFAIAHQTAEGTRITFWDRDFTRQPYLPVVVGGAWQEGPGLVRQLGGHAPVSTSDPCGTVPIDLLRATALNPAPTDIRQSGLDITGARGCDDPARARAVLGGFAVPSPERTVDLVVGAQKLRMERRSVTEKLARGVVGERIPALDALPVQGTIPAQAMALRSPAGQVALLDDRGQLWVVPPEAAAANESTVIDASQQLWDKHRIGGDLSRLRS